MTITITEIMTLALFMVFFLFAEVANGFPYHKETDAIKTINPIPVSENNAYHAPPESGLTSPENIHYLKEKDNEKHNEKYETDRNQGTDPQHNAVG